METHRAERQKKRRTDKEAFNRSKTLRCSTVRKVCRSDETGRTVPNLIKETEKSAARSQVKVAQREARNQRREAKDYYCNEEGKATFRGREENRGSSEGHWQMNG